MILCEAQLFAEHRRCQIFMKSYTNFITVSAHDNMTSRQVS
jgi:hypothetical protein